MRKFPGMGIIHTAKKDVPALLQRKFMETVNNSAYNMREIRMQCENAAKTINLNIVRLRFSAHDVHTGREICPPVHSDPIHNLKSAATNDLKICRISKVCGRSRGGEDVYIFVEKVNKKNIEIRFYELSETGEEVWSAKAHFLQSDVHHQYGIVFRTPPYKNRDIASDVAVFVELRRPSDGRTSEPKPFTYKKDDVAVQCKKRKANSYSSYDSSTGSLKSIDELPITVHEINTNTRNQDIIMNDMSMCTLQMIPKIHQNQGTNDQFAEALFSGVISGPMAAPTAHNSLDPIFSQPSIPEPMISGSIRLTSQEFNQLLQETNILRPEDRGRLSEENLDEYFRNTDNLLQQVTAECDESEVGVSSMGFINLALVSDSGKRQPADASGRKTPQESSTKKTTAATDKSPDYTAYYKQEDGAKVKQLVMELCDIMRNKGDSIMGNRKQLVVDKLESLFDIRLSNGDTFLHLTLCSNQPSLEFIVKMIHNVKMVHLLNLRNNEQQTILHLAIMNELNNLVPFLVSRGCNPMVEGSDGHNAVHYAVMYQSCLEPLLKAIKTYSVPCDLNAYNNEKQTALHLSSLYASPESARLLLQHGASAIARDANGRTPLHLAVLDDYLEVVRVLLDFIPASDVDAVDGNGNTALQMACDGDLRTNTMDIVRLLLDKKADPLQHEDSNYSAWKLVRDKPRLRQLLECYLSTPMSFEDDVKSEPEDDFESADEGDSEVSLANLARYIGEVSALLDAKGAWRVLATRLQQDSLINWYANTSSPTTTLLNHVKECEEVITSKSLAMILADMGQAEAAEIIRSHID